ncbi:hypothetical protein K438DRAFT_1768228 [Mycena galopus ATCC 62051]|nr:hypothetical protein K438DRAFT_1768228 [Mycena galopus ATCC 62051]
MNDIGFLPRTILTADLYPDRDRLRIGILYSIIGLALLGSNPIAGAFLASCYIWWRPLTFRCEACFASDSIQKSRRLGVHLLLDDTIFKSSKRTPGLSDPWEATISRDSSEYPTDELCELYAVVQFMRGIMREICNEDLEPGLINLLLTSGPNGAVRVWEDQSYERDDLDFGHLDEQEDYLKGELKNNKVVMKLFEGVEYVGRRELGPWISRIFAFAASIIITKYNSAQTDTDTETKASFNQTTTGGRSEWDGCEIERSYCRACLERFVDGNVWRWFLAEQIKGGWVPPKECCDGYDCKTMVEEEAHAEDKNRESGSDRGVLAPVRAYNGRRLINASGAGRVERAREDQEFQADTNTSLSIRAVHRKVCHQPAAPAVYTLPGLEGLEGWTGESKIPQSQPEGRNRKWNVVLCREVVGRRERETEARTLRQAPIFFPTARKKGEAEGAELALERKAGRKEGAIRAAGVKLSRKP